MEGIITKKNDHDDSIDDNETSSLLTPTNNIASSFTSSMSNNKNMNTLENDINTTTTNETSDSSSSSTSAGSLNIRIRCTAPSTNNKKKTTTSTYTGGDYNIKIPPPSQTTVHQLKTLIRNAVGQTSKGRYLRVILKGRLLAPDQAKLSGFGSWGDGDVVHAVLAAAGVRGGHQVALSRTSDEANPTDDNIGSGFVNPRRRRQQRDHQQLQQDPSRHHQYHPGTGVGPTGLAVRSGDNDDYDDEDDDDDDLESGGERMGFDRLRSTGLSRSEIAAIRLYFSRQVDRYIDQQNRLREDDTDDADNTTSTHTEQSNTETENTSENVADEIDNDDDTADAETRALRERLRMEDEWMELQGPTSEFRLNLNVNNPLLFSRSLLFSREQAMMGRGGGSATGAASGTVSSVVGNDKDFIWGFILGFFVGFLMLFWVWMPTVPHKQKLGILSGICFHLVLNLLNDENTADFVEG